MMTMMMTNTSVMKTDKKYLNACKHGEWLAKDDKSFVSIHKVHKSKKTYSRKIKHKNK